MTPDEIRVEIARLRDLASLRARMVCPSLRCKIKQATFLGDLDSRELAKRQPQINRLERKLERIQQREARSS
ncbi:MAG TPA: hypothetical protein VL614_00770 [Acetobacteraceae bacterium]|jgi:hypothetical protein|nr:hypothetical protein [Acetobacteraceae bacterium]